MLELRFAGAWRLMSVVTLLLVMTATLVPPEWLWPDDRSLQFHVSDKWLHGITFTVLTLWFCGQYARPSYWRIVLGLLVFGALIEITQRAVSYRSAEWLDLVADLAGIATGMMMAMAGAGGWTPRFELWLQDQFG